MPSPFPGMDPYLENPSQWRGVHQRLLTALTQLLNTDLPAGLYADSEDRVIVSPGRNIYPDVGVLRFATAPNRPLDSGRGGVATLLETSADPSFYVRHETQPPQQQITIRTVDSKELVAVIELLSPTNKRRGKDREEYLAKQAELLASDVHLIEIDLLREGVHSVAVSQEDIQTRGEGDYVVCLHYGGSGEEFEFWLSTLRQRLPRIRIPLTDGLPDQILDLQRALDQAYDSGPHRRGTDYRLAPIPPLSETDADWADSLLRNAGLR